MHIFPNGPHGLGLANNVPHVAQWSDLLLNWLIYKGWVNSNCFLYLEVAWEFIKWFMSDDTQISYAMRMESLLGSCAKVNTANAHAFFASLFETALFIFRIFRVFFYSVDIN